MNEWEALERAGEDRLVQLITETWRLVARDHKQTFRMLALHPPVERITIGDDTPTDDTADHDTDPGSTSDPTGEAAIHGTDAARRQEAYSELLARAYVAIELLDSIRRKMMPASEAPEPTDDQWCKNCITAKVFNPRKAKYHHCWWCIDVRQIYGALPPQHIIEIREQTGDPARIAKALDDWRKPKRQ